MVLRGGIGMKDEELKPYIGKCVEIKDIDGDIVKGVLRYDDKTVAFKNYPYYLYWKGTQYRYKKSHIKKIREICE